MAKRVANGSTNPMPAKSSKELSVVDLADARVRLRSRSRPTNDSLMLELDEVRSLLDQGLSSEAKSRLASIITSARNSPNILALARCSLSTALEMQGSYRESLAVVEMYESPESREKFDEQTISHLRVQLGLAYNYNGDHPRAVALLKAALRDYTEHGDDSRLGHTYAALAKIYRSISEFPIARDYAQRALEHFRQTGDWRGLADSYIAIGLADIQEGLYESGLENFDQALKLIGERSAAYVLGRIYANMAGACWFLKRPQEGIRYL